MKNKKTKNTGIKNWIKFEDKVDFEISTEPEINKITANDINSIKDTIYNCIPIFYKEQIIILKNRSSITNFLAKFNNLVENIDYQIINDNALLGLGNFENQGITGNNYISQNNIPLKNWSFYGLFNANINASDRRTILPSTNTTASTATLSNYYWYVGVDSRTFQNININYINWSFGVSNPNEFKPKQYNFNGIIFLKDIYAINLLQN